MRATINGIEVEGTFAEICELLDRFGKAEDAGKRADSARVHEEGDEAFKTIPTQFAYRTLKRIPLSRSQKGLLFFLKDRHPNWTLASEIHQAFDWEGNQLGGVLGGLGRRLTATRGYKEGYELWQYQWDEDEGQYAYRLPDTVIAAIERLE